MKKIFVVVLLLSGGSLLSYGQCDKKVVLTASRTEYLGADSSLQRAEDEQTVIEFDKTNIMIAPGDHKMAGTITSYSCNWPTPFKDGKTVIRVTLSENEGGETKKLTITIEGKAGKIKLLAEMEDDATKKIRLNADSFEEKKG
jgi:hypothetical protein